MEEDRTVQSPNVCLRGLTTSQLEELMPRLKAGLVFGKPTRPCTQRRVVGGVGLRPKLRLRVVTGGDAAHDLIRSRAWASKPRCAISCAARSISRL